MRSKINRLLIIILKLFILLFIIFNLLSCQKKYNLLDIENLTKKYDKIDNDTLKNYFIFYRGNQNYHIHYDSCNFGLNINDKIDKSIKSISCKNLNFQKIKLIKENFEKMEVSYLEKDSLGNIFLNPKFINSVLLYKIKNIKYDIIKNTEDPNNIKALANNWYINIKIYEQYFK